MDQPLGRVLKAEDVQLQGTYHLTYGQSGGVPAAAANTVAGPQVRMLEQHADYAVIEVTCACGTTSRVRCEYRDTQTNA